MDQFIFLKILYSDAIKETLQFPLLHEFYKLPQPFPPFRRRNLSTDKKETHDSAFIDVYIYI